MPAVLGLTRVGGFILPSAVETVRLWPATGARQFIDAILADQRPKRFAACSDVVSLLRERLNRGRQRRVGGPGRQLVEEIHHSVATTADVGGLLLLAAGHVV